MDALDLTFSDGEAPSRPGRAQEVLGLALGVGGLLFALSLLSYAPGDGLTNWIGAAGHWLAGLALTSFGLAAWVVPVELALGAYRLFSGRPSRMGRAAAGSAVVSVIVGAALLQVVAPLVRVYGEHLPGGLHGEAIGEVLRSAFGTVGAVLLTVSVLLASVALRSPITLSELGQRLGRVLLWAVGRVREGLLALHAAWRAAKAIEEAATEGDGTVGESLDEADASTRETLAGHADAPKIVAAPGVQLTRTPTAAGRSSPGMTASASPEDTMEEATVDVDGLALDVTDEPDREAQSVAGIEAPPLRKKGAAPRIIAPSGTPRPKAKPAKAEPRGPFLLPPSSLLQKAPTEELRIDPKVLRENATLLVEKLKAYGVSGRVDEIHPGPVVTMYEFEPESGTKVSKIAGLADDLAMALAAQKVRIVAPIPGKARVGFELPNEKRKMVYLREIVEDGRWLELEGSLPMALGQDIAGQPVYTDLSTMPHVLVAGATGAGKSVGLNVMLTSLLMRKSPEEVRFLMIDPKVVELAVFDGIPHMLLPVVTDMKKAALALRWAVDEMERRYQLFADAGARSIDSFNRKVDKVLSGEMPADKLFPSRAGKVRAQGPEGEEVLLDPVDGEPPDANTKPPEKLPHIVVVVDEFADLMMVAAKDVEAAIARLAQKARAAGIHVILATQRPSVDVITGMIKANFPCRIGFKVSQREDSKTILGRQGAEHLLGRGDMLMIPPGSSDLKRVHSAFVSEDDVKGVCDYLRLQGAPVYDDEILKPRDEEAEGGGEAGGGASSDDPVYDRAVAIVAQAGYCSISHLQRQLSLGYNKAAKLVEQMERNGIVGPASSKAGGRREVLIQPV